MNIFVLDENPVLSAKWHCDKHVVKMILEYAQIMSTVWHDALSARGQEAMLKSGMIYKPTHRKHPCTLWAGDNSDNYHWLSQQAYALCAEYTVRYGKVHKSQAVIEALRYPPESLRVKPVHYRMQFVQCMPEEYRCQDPVQAYRNFYNKAKARFATWKAHRPVWFKDAAV